MSRAGWGALAALLAGCASLPTTSEGVAFLQVEQPADRTIDVGGTLQLHAVALDKSGRPLDVSILWRTPDTTLTVSATGLVTAVAPDSGRVQAVIGDDELVSNFITIIVRDTAAALRRP
ncbi:MAG TPA: hypothetical protein VL241_08445 [Gemmatimonadales bacterium]|jgi:hypothetical protein|nr:hypothetical protein [Gemmatimonadales bacterium]